MNNSSDTILRISPGRTEVFVEQEKDGVISRKSIAPDTLVQCFLSSRYDDEVHATGFLPEGCFAAAQTAKHTWYFIRYPELYADISYYDTEYPHFPIPRLVFGFQYLAEEKKVVKVRILNGAHTSMVLAAYLAGRNIVRECMEDAAIHDFMNRTIYEEIIPTLDLPREELEDFAAAVTERFNNPYIDHALLSITLNSTAKWKARVLPSLTEYVRRYGKLPACLTFSFAAYIAFYHTAKERGENCLIGRRNG